MNAPRIITHRLYRADSPTLRGPFLSSGLITREGGPIENACMGEDCPPGTLHWIDTAVAPEHGNLVMVWHADEDGSGRVHTITKRLFLIAGEQFIACRWFICPLSWIPNLQTMATVVKEEFGHPCPPNVQHQVRAETEAEWQAWRAKLNGYPENQRAIRRLSKMALTLTAKNHETRAIRNIVRSLKQQAQVIRGGG